MKKCDHCAEQIQDEAVVCWHCGRYTLEAVEAVRAREEDAARKQEDTLRKDSAVLARKAVNAANGFIIFGLILGLTISILAQDYLWTPLTAYMSWSIYWGIKVVEGPIKKWRIGSGLLFIGTNPFDILIRQLFFNLTIKLCITFIIFLTGLIVGALGGGFYSHAKYSKIARTGSERVWSFGPQLITLGVIAVLIFNYTVSQHSKASPDSLHVLSGVPPTEKVFEPSTEIQRAEPAQQLEPAVSPIEPDVSTQASTPSFDCSKASNDVERMICSDQKLSELDKRMAVAYYQARQSGPSRDAQQELKETQVVFLRNRNQCTDAGCIEEITTSRLKTLHRYAIPLSTQNEINSPYQTLKPTSVYREPREHSQKLASIESGIRINVVAVHGDWLEVRSKHGNPPGFIKREFVVPIGNRTPARTVDAER